MNKKFLDLIQNAPENSGVYQMYDKFGNILYVGKAKNLKKRLFQYTDPDKLSTQKALMVSLIDKLELKITENEHQALILEQDLIKSKKPKYNIVMMDSKMYPFLMLTDDKYPRILKYRGKITDKSNVFGPFTDVGALIESIKVIQKVFGIRTCRNSLFNNRVRPCLLYQLGKCSGACCQKISHSDYMKSVSDLTKFLQGKTTDVLSELSQKMLEASKNEDFELAAKYRDKITALNSIINMKTKNVMDKLTRENQRISDALPELEKFVGVKNISRIDVFDNSHLFGKNPVGAMIVVSQNGFDKREYRHYKLQNQSVAGNDIGMMEEFLTRRYGEALKKENLPDLIILDGGIAQFNIAKSVMEKLNLNVPLFGIVKGEVRSGDEHFILPDGSTKNLENGSLLFLALDLMRDEAHRFAISFHRRVRDKNFVSSALDEIEGIGASRKKLLLSYFGSVERIASASLKDLERVPNISKSIAKKIYGFFHSDLIR